MSNDDIMLTPLHKRSDFGSEPWSLDKKIQIFQEQYGGWQIDIAKRVIEYIKDYGFAVLGIVMSYFQAIARFKGYKCKGRDSNFKEFEYGLLDVFPEVKQLELEYPQEADIIVSRLWASVRCGLYHNGLIYGLVNITEDIKQPILYEKDSDILDLNPRLFVCQLDNHFKSYMVKLKDTNENNLRKNFLNWFDEVIKEEDKNFQYAKLKRQMRREGGSRD